TQPIECDRSYVWCKRTTTGALKKDSQWVNAKADNGAPRSAQRPRLLRPRAMRTAQSRRTILSGTSCPPLSMSNQDVDEPEQPVEDKNSDTENQGRKRVDRRPRKRKEAFFNKPEPDDCDSGHR